MIEAKIILNIFLLQVADGLEGILYVTWIVIIIVGVAIRISRKKQMRKAHSKHEFKLDKEIFDSFNNRLKEDYFNKGQLISSQNFGTYTTTLKDVNGLLIEKVTLNGKLNSFRVHKSIQEYENSKPTTKSIDIQGLGQEYHQWLGKEATEEELKEIFREPKPSTVEERSRIDRNSRFINENNDGLPF